VESVNWLTTAHVALTVVESVNQLDASVLVDLKGLGEHKNYQKDAQLVIGQMRTAAFCKARSLGVDLCWSLDSDVLPPPNALRCLKNALEFDLGHYSVAMVTYPSQGGGGFLGGFGTHYRHINPDFFEEERNIPEELAKEVAEVRAALKEKPMDEALHKRHGELNEKINKCPPKGNIFEMIAKHGYKRRGWMQDAYPGIGRGAMVPTDWIGFGCTLLNKKALQFAHFDGYEGAGTEDLYIGWRKWFPENIKMAVITHCLCDHVIRNPGKPGKYVLCQAYHEVDGECKDHPRVRHLPWYSFDPGERFDETNDGKLVNSTPESEKTKEPEKANV